MSDISLSRSSEIIKNFLQDVGMSFEVKTLQESTRTADDAAKAIGCEVGQICKSIIFKDNQSNKPVLVLASGINRINEKSIKDFVGEKILKADADFTREVTGFAIGGIPPIAHRTKIEKVYIIDQDLKQYESIWAAAGTPNSVFELNFESLVKMTGGVVVSIK